MAKSDFNLEAVANYGGSVLLTVDDDEVALAARGHLAEALAVANGSPSWARTCYRSWLTEPSEGLRLLCGQAGEDYRHWMAHRAPQLLGQWRRYPGPAR